MDAEPVTHDKGMITTAGTMIGIKYSGGIILTSDRAVSYGSQYKFANVPHFLTLTPSCVIGCTGEMADFQELSKLLSATVRQFECESGGEAPTPSEIFTLAKRVLYQRRNKLDPLMMKIVVAGVNRDGSSFLAAADMYGTNWEDDVITTGMGLHMKGLQLDRAVNRSRDEVITAIKQVMTGLCARTIQGAGPWDVIDITSDGITELEPIRAEIRHDLEPVSPQVDADGWAPVEKV